jgi:pyruvate-formate lyase-activating enzyme
MKIDAAQPLTALVADAEGRIFDLPGYAAVGMSGERFEPLTRARTIGLPYGSELMYLPDRVPVLLDLARGELQAVPENPQAPGGPIYPVAVFNSPGYVITEVSGFRERPRARALPLFSYGAVGWQRGGFRSAAFRVDWELRQDLRRMDPQRVKAGVRALRRRLPQNRLVRHLETCALQNGCPAGKNFFLGRYEAPLPTAVTCNARCLGCLSLQKDTGISCTQDRIGFTPAPGEIAEAALLHIGRVDRAVVSFGQGCEGEPLTAADTIEAAIRLIRAATRKGTINLNTNAGLPDRIARLCAAGLDSIRVSLNSLRPECYTAYVRPRGFAFADVLRSIDTALEHGRFVSINYLNSPGFTDTEAEAAALMRFLEDHPIHMIQWRNLNFDPLRYWKAMRAAAPTGPPIGMDTLAGVIRRRFPRLKFGYFNPPRQKFKRL